MKKASLRMFLVALLLLPTLAAAEEYQLQFVRLDQGNTAQPAAPCNTDPDLAAIFSPMQGAEVKSTYNASSGSECCTKYGCCALIETGCDRCINGYHWYKLYRCDDIHGCRVNPIACPTAC